VPHPARGAGAGKTSTLKLAAGVLPGRGYYIAFNKAVASEAAREFPGHVNCSTAHSLAMSAVGRPYSHRLNGPRMPARESAKVLGITGPLRADENRVLAPQQVARLVMETVGRFTHSADEVISGAHIPRQAGLDSDAAMAVLREALPPLARRAWADLVSTEGKLRFDHDCYLKIWQLTHPQLSADFIFLDEAQDSDAVVLDVVTSQRSSQLIAVGDRAQQIYEWRGAVDAMDKFPGAARLSLSQSFRFGSAISAEANKWLEILGSVMRLTGNPRRSSMVTPLEKAQAVLCRTNGGALGQAMRALEAGQKVAIVGGGKQIRALAEAAEALKAGRATSHPELWAFKTWAEVQDYVENDAGGGDLRVMVGLIDEHGPDVIKGVCDRLADEKAADTVVSTAHKAKGLEWDSVRIAGDFREPRKNPERPDEEPKIPPADARLAYVAITRAKLSLDRTGLAWVDKYLTGGAS
jgi:superfamily I DNA/RNA helicase